VPPAPDGARFDRAIDSLEFHNQRLERLCALFPSFKKISHIVGVVGHGPSNGASGKHDRDQRFASDRLEAGDPLDPDDGETGRPVSPTPEAKAANGHSPAEA
jgi:hypothetical protein